jgi:hypothetical protein
MFLTDGGNSDSTTTPASQNQLVTSAPHQSRPSLRKSLISVQVEVAIFLLMIRLGAASPVRGISSAETQHSKAKAITNTENTAGLPPPLAAMPPTIVPSRMAMKVAPSTSALPAGNSRRAR